MSINGRDKGARNEREVARLVQSWWEAREPGCQFVRTPMSGGWGTTNTREHFRASGDLMTTAVDFPFTIEVKAREGWSTANVLSGARSPVWGWWKQTITAATEQHSIPMLWFRKRHKAWLILLPLQQRLPIEPDVVYPTVAKAGVEYHGHRPVLYFADRLLAMHPKDIAYD